MADDLFSNPTHPTPPWTEDERLDWLRLIRSRRVGAVTFHRLMAEHGSARAALAALPEIARAAGVQGYAVCPVEVARAEMAQARLAGAVPLFLGANDYPQALMDLPDAPPVLWAQGDISLACAADGGDGGRAQCLVPGRADGAAAGRRAGAGGVHAWFRVWRAALMRRRMRRRLATGTVAVQAGGVDVIYPAGKRRNWPKISAMRGLAPVGTTHGHGAADPAFPDAQPASSPAFRAR